MQFHRRRRGTLACRRALSPSWALSLQLSPRQSSRGPSRLAIGVDGRLFYRRSRVLPLAGRAGRRFRPRVDDSVPTLVTTCPAHKPLRASVLIIKRTRIELLHHCADRPYPAAGCSAGTRRRGTFRVVSRSQSSCMPPQKLTDRSMVIRTISARKPSHAAVS